jgi:D-arabinose 1-dehydrogenase-like Zn-dependent alcohol dehydrogenase
VIGLGGVGIHAAQVALSAGGRVIGLDVHPPTLQRAIELGIDARRSDDESIVRATFDETDGEGLDVVVETVGRDETLSLAVELLRPGGRLVGVGYSPTSALRVTTPRLVLGELDLVGSRFAHRDDMENAVRLVAAGAVQPVIGLVAPLEDVNDVFEALERGDVVGRAVLDIAGARDVGAAAGA